MVSGMVLRRTVDDVDLELNAHIKLWWFFIDMSKIIEIVQHFASTQACSKRAL